MKTSALIKILTDILVENWELNVWLNFQEWIYCYSEDCHTNIEDIKINL